MKDLFDFFKADAQEPAFAQRSFEVLDGKLITSDARGYCPGSCCCIDCAAHRVRINRFNRRAAAALAKQLTETT